VQSTGADSNFLSARTQVLPSSNLPAVLAIAYTAFHNLMQPETYQQYSAEALKPLKQKPMSTVEEADTWRGQ
jgi:hypothetical protein